MLSSSFSLVRQRKTWDRVGEHAPVPNEITDARCDGFGQTRAAFKDTTKLSPAAQALFAGVKETQHGLEIKMNDQSKALELLARHIGMFPSKVEHTGKGGGPIQTEDLTAVKTEEELIEQARKLGLDPGALGLGGGEETQE